jgi:6-pyruvoyltetrahydropterin/6-carboxytetrahydropterin synthase
MSTTVFKDFKFSAAHHLCIPGHKCSTMHGHNYRVRIECAGTLDGNGMIVDFHEIKQRVDPIIDQLDHKFLNEVIQEGTTSEHICAWIAKRANDQLKTVVRVTVWETDSCGAIIEL